MNVLEDGPALGYSTGRPGAELWAGEGGDHIRLTPSRARNSSAGSERGPAVLRVPGGLARRAWRLAGAGQRRGTAGGVAPRGLEANRPVPVVDHEPLRNAGRPRRLHPQPRGRLARAGALALAKG